LKEAIDIQKAVLSSLGMRIQDLEKEAFEFKRDIVVGAENARTGKIMAEKLTRWMDERLKGKDASIEKLRLTGGEPLVRRDIVDIVGKTGGE
jgi:organic radical activating enzyme